VGKLGEILVGWQYNYIESTFIIKENKEPKTHSLKTFMTDRGKWRDSCLFSLQLRQNAFIFKGGGKNKNTEG
jgi:hypothetical protein